MAQANLLRKAKSLFSTTLNSGIGTGTSETITPNSVTGLPTDTEVTLTFDRVDANGDETPSKMERITGTISGGNLTSYTRGVDGSTEQAHAAGAVIEYIFCADDWNDHIDHHLVEHNDDGTHSTITSGIMTNASVASTISASTVTASNLTASAVSVSTTLTIPTASSTASSVLGYLNSGQQLTVGTGDVAAPIYMGAWTSFTPSWTNITEGSATNSGTYCQIGKTVHFQAGITLASDSSVDGSVSLTLPQTVSSSYSQSYDIIGQGLIYVSGYYHCLIYANGGVRVIGHSATYNTVSTVNATVPDTFTTGSIITLQGTYWAA